jgi:hypothetical protein
MSSRRSLIACACLAVAAAACGDDARSAAPAAKAAESSAPAAAGADQQTSAARSGAAASIRALTGTRARVVWVEGDGTDPYAAGTNLVLMGLDTEDGKGERVILGERGSFLKPMLISDGRRIVYSSHGKDPSEVTTFVVNWDGSGKKVVAKGFALAVWTETAGNRDWVYVGTDNSVKSAYDFHTVTRFPVDDPSARQLVWNKTLVSGDTFQVSADGRTAGGLFPWPKAGVASLPNGDLQTLGDGCWTAFRDAGDGLFWYFDGSHRNVNIVDRKTDRRWMVALNRAPGFDNPEVYHPRWANHPRFVAISGPYNRGGPNQVRSGGTQAEIYLGRFSADYSRIEAWARVTQNNAGDSYPDIWIERANSPYPIEIARTAAADKKPAGAPAKNPVTVEARLASVATIPPPRSIAPYRHALVVNTYDVVNVVQGEYKTPKILVAQWAIRDARVLDEARQRSVGTTARLTLERYDAHPELEGERLIAGSNMPDLPLYYDVTRR